MRRLALIFAILPSAAFAGPTDGFYRNPVGPSIQVQGATGDGFDFGLTAGASDGSYSCPEGETDCLHVAGHATLQGKFFTYIDPDDATSRIFFAVSDAGIKLVSTTGPLGTGTANRLPMVDLPGLYAPEFLGDAVEGDPTTQNAAATEADSGDQMGAADELHAFRSPTGNVSCLFALGDSAEVRCDLTELNRSFTTPPADCDLEWGDSFSIGEMSKRGSLVCHGDTVIDPQAQVLEYGSTLGYFGIVCTSAKTGMSCVNNQGHGFSVARKLQSVF